MAKRLRAPVPSRMFSFPLPSHSQARLLPFGCGSERQEHGRKAWRKPSWSAWREGSRQARSQARPGQASQKLTLKSVVANPDRTIKISAFPDGPCKCLLFLPFRLTGVIPLLWLRVYLIPLMPDTLVPGWQFGFLSWTRWDGTEPLAPSPTAAPLTGKCIILSLQPGKILKTPLAAAIGNWFRGVSLEVVRH